MELKRCAICGHKVQEVRRASASERHGSGVKRNQWVCSNEHQKPFKL